MSVDIDQIKSTFDRIGAAWQSNDGVGVASFFVEDGSLINPFGERADGRDAIASMYSEYFGGMLRDTSTSVDLGSVRTVGNDHAFADGEQTIYAGNGEVVLAVHISALMRRDGDNWRIVDGRPYAFATVPA